MDSGFRRNDEQNCTTTYGRRSPANFEDFRPRL